MAERGDVHDIGVDGMNPDPGNDLRVGQAHMDPGVTGVGRLVHPVALHDVPAQRDLAHADVDHVRIGLGDSDGTDR